MSDSRPDRFRDPVDDCYDAVVVGAGLGGLVSAALLCRAGKGVLLLDGHYVAGGNATVFRRKDYEFDIGIHYLGDCGPNGFIPKVLRACGAGEITFRPMETGMERMTFPDFEFTIPRDRNAFRQALVDRFPSEEKGIRRYIRFLEQVDRMGSGGLGMSKGRQLGVILASPLLRRFANRSFGEFLDSCTGNRQLRAVITAQNGTYAIAPSRVSAILHAGLQNHYFRDGGWYPEGGGQVLADGLAGAIETSGGQIRLRSKVEKIHVEDGAVTGVTFVNKHLGKKTVRAPLVVSNADLKRTVLELVGAEYFPAGFAKRVQEFEMAMPLFVVYLGLDIPATELPYGNVNRWLFSGYDFDGAYQEVSEGRMRDIPFLYVATASLKDPHNRRLAPEGHTNMQIMTVVPPQPSFWGLGQAELADGSYAANKGYETRKNELTDRMIEQAEALIPGLRDHVVFKEAATPITHSRYTGSTGGTSYGIAATPEQFLDRRPGTTTTVKGLYLAGASTRSGHGIAGVMLSGVQAAAAILGDDTAERVLRS
ncbi:MAG: phytoene desaturase family protein [Candidatus Binatia bacterium]